MQTGGIAYVKTPKQQLKQQDESGCVILVLNLHAKKHVNVQVKVELEVRVRTTRTTDYTSMVLKYIVKEGKLVTIGFVMIIGVISVTSVVGKSKENAEIIRIFQIING